MSLREDSGPVARRGELDLLRLWACVGVLLIHSSSEYFWALPLESTAFRVLMFASSAVRGSVPLFFMLSGALLLGRERLDYRRSVRNHALRLLGLFFFWSLVYALSRLAVGKLDNAGDFLLSLVSGYYHLWFLPAMAMCCLFLPLLHAALHRETLEARRILWPLLLFGLLLPNLRYLTRPVPLLEALAEDFRPQYLAYLGYMLWGAWLDSRPMPKTALRAAPLVWLLASLGAALVNIRYSCQQQVAFGWLFDYFTLPSFLQASAAFCFFLCLRGRAFRRPGLLKALSDACLGVYLLHPLLIEALVLLLPSGLAPFPAFLLLSLLLTLLSFGLVLALRRFPPLRRLM